jgi:hypothetical protein
MEFLLLAIAFVFYLATRFTQTVLGFSSALLHVSRPRLGFALYWGFRALELGTAYAAFDFEQWLVYFAGIALGAAYLPFYADGAERTGARASRWFRRLRVWRLLHWWTDFRVEPEVFGVRSHTLFAVHPHGFLPVSVALAFALVGREGPIVVMGPIGRTETTVDPLVAASSVLFWIPFLRDVCLWAGCVAADESVMLEALKTRSLVVAPGGVGEGTLHDHNKLRVSFEHVGFLRVARQAGASVQPMFAQGENRVWVVMPGWRAMRRLASRRIFYAFPTVFVPFLFPHCLRLRYRAEDAYVLHGDGSVGQPHAAWFAERVTALIRTYEDDEDIDVADATR